MMQSNVVNAMLLIPKNVDSLKNATVKVASSNDDTFMNMLKERISAGRENRLKDRPVETNSNLRKSYVLRDDAKPNNDLSQKPVVQKLDNKAESTTEVSKPETKGKPETESIKNEDGQKEKIEEEINSLEALIALLEELMARLDINNVADYSSTTETSSEIVLSSEAKELSPMELLMALVEGDTAKLKTMLNELGDSQHTPEIIDLMEKIQGLIEKLTKEQVIDPLELKAEIVDANVNKEALMNQFKAQCGQLIDKLNEQVSRLNEALNKVQDAELQTDTVLTGIEPENKVAEEPVKAESEAQDETKDTKGDSAAFAKDVNTSNVKAGADIENPFENIIIQNQQMPNENLNQPVSLEKAQFPLSEKPLAQTVTNQVMMKVKLMAGENKQEMEMHLKPDSLGKLSLKIIHERGEILAKITAENQQVKGILESNLQMLKDALEKSGLTVQSLSVSVGNNKEDYKNKENGNEKDRTQSTGLARAKNVSSQVDTDRLNLRTRIEKEYFEDTSQINLTA